MKRKMNFKRNVLMILMVATIPAQAGWFDGFGDRIKRGIVNTIQNNISGRANKAADKATDAVLDAPGKAVNKEADVKETETKSNRTELNSEVMEAKPKGYYEELDDGFSKYKARIIASYRLEYGERSIKIEKRLQKGRYLILLIPNGWEQKVNVVHNGNYGQNLILEKYIMNHGLKDMTGKKGGTSFIVRVEETGIVQMRIDNNLELNGVLELHIQELAPGQLK